MPEILAQSLSLPYGAVTPAPIVITGPLTKFTTLGDLISEAIRYIFPFAGILLLLMILSAGFSFLTSAGDPKKMEAGKSRLTNALIGFMIIFMAYWIVQIAGAIFGIQEIKDIFGLQGTGGGGGGRPILAQ